MPNSAAPRIPCACTCARWARVELLTREGEIEIAKRIEDGLKHMIQAISSCPTTIEEILRLADLIEKDEMRIDELVDGLVDGDEEEVVEEEMTEEEELEELDAEEQEAEDEAVASADLEELKQNALGALQQDPAPVQEDEEGALGEGLPFARLQGPAGRHLQRAARDPLHREAGRAPVQRASRAGRARALGTSARSWSSATTQREHAARALHQGVPGQRDQPQVGRRGSRHQARPTPRRSTASAPRWSSSRTR